MTRDLQDFQRRAMDMERESNKSLDLLPDLSAEKPTPEQITEELKNWRAPH